MAIAKMNRFSLLTFHAHKQPLLKELQVFGNIHLRTLGQQELMELDFLHPDFSPEQLGRYEIELEKVRFAVSKLAPYVEKPKMGAKRGTLSFEQFDRYANDYDYGAVFEKVRQQDEAVAGYKSEIARRLAENDGLAAWVKLDVSPSDLGSLTETGHLIGSINKQVAEEFASKLAERYETAYLEMLDTVKEDTTLLLLFPAEQAEEVYAFAREMGFTKAALQMKRMPKTVIQENLEEIESLKNRIKEATEALKALAPEHPKLQIALDYYHTVLEREKATQNFLSSDALVLMEGWVPADESAKLQSILYSVCGNEYYLDEEAVEKDSETVPIKLKNNAFVGSFENITSMYSLPRYNELDPTPVMAPFYWLFFGMMVGDVGYGLVMLLGTCLALKFMDLKEGMRNFIKFFRNLSFAVILMGSVYGGVFGVTLIKPIAYTDATTGLTAYKSILDSQADITTMLILSLVIGVVQILFGLCVKMCVGFRDHDIAAAIFDGLFWIITVVSGLGWLVSVTGIISPEIGSICMWVFIASLVGLALTQGRSSPSIGGKIGNGLYGVYGLTSYVGDIVSYTRIVALALSSAYIAYAFNLIFSMVAGDFGSGNIVVSIIRFIFAAVIVVFGQTLNLGLAMLGGFVHTCRLQYVEYFGKFYEGGGVVFRPLVLKNEYIHIK